MSMRLMRCIRSLVVATTLISPWALSGQESGRFFTRPSDRRGPGARRSNAEPGSKSAGRYFKSMFASSRDGNVRSMLTTAPDEGLSVRENVSLVPRIVPVESMPYAPFASAVQ